MLTQVYAIPSSVTQGVMPISRPSTIHSLSSDNEWPDSIHIVNPQIRILEIATQPDFHIFTSLLWIRKPEHDISEVGRVQGLCNTVEHESSHLEAGIPNQSRPDLGLLAYHQQRLADTAEKLHWRDISALERNEKGLRILRSSITMYLRCLPALPLDRVERRKIRLMVGKLGTIKVDSTVIDRPLTTDLVSADTPFLPNSLGLDTNCGVQIQLNDETLPSHEICQVFLDTQPCRPSLFTTHKTSHRDPYNQARARAKITAFAPTDKEVLIYNTNGEIMEASLCTVYFYRDGRWITPAAICGGNMGVTRRLALEKALCKQGTIEISAVEDGEKIWLSNGARGFFVGQICLKRQDAGFKGGISS